MFGFIDPETVQITDSQASFKFINALTGETSDHTLSDPQEIREAARRVMEQSTTGRGITTFDGPPISEFIGTVEIQRGKLQFREKSTNRKLFIEFQKSIRKKIGKKRWDARVIGALDTESDTIHAIRVELFKD